MARRIALSLLAALAAAVPAFGFLNSQPTISNFGRLIDPAGRVSELGHFPVGAVLTPDGRFLWTVGAGIGGGGVRITSTADGSTVQTIDDSNRSGGVVISPDGTR